MMMKKAGLILLFFISRLCVYPQTKTDTAFNKVHADSLVGDSGKSIVNTNVETYQSRLNKILAANKFINLGKSNTYIIKRKHSKGKEFLFYLVSIIILLFGLFKIFYSRYFDNIFRVFFNTSLRQNQLTDLLLQARLPSLIFNIFFTISAGLYVWLLLSYYYLSNKNFTLNILLYSVLIIGAIYFAKFCVLKFIGFITGMAPAINTYIFVIFLINKIVGIILIPFIIFFAFGSPEFVQSAIILSFLLIAIFFLLRFFRSYGLLQHQLHLSRFHFMVYIISLEVLPLVITYKLVLRFLASA